MEKRRRNHTELAVHLVWTTWKRMPLIRSSELERSLWRVIQNEAEILGCSVLAIGGMPDHVHLVLVQPPSLSLSKLLNQLKGVSSSVARTQLGSEAFFQWAEGYSAFSLSSTHCQNAIAYVQSQKEHHSLETLWERWEETPDLELWAERPS
ncbi:IS200/IS605 family transposase [Armatimonas rosea]|uniref:REP element-mobilizing transposase RayT n=1 Tax=Armatimonas rosea TaxID=685828 RepID=A0A7W9SRN4_ARMRO|nr:REP element-mobilizing transposase RayT [Armatimonas rosea]